MNNNATLILFFKKNFLNIIFIVLFIIASIVFLTKIQKYLILKKFSKVIFISFFQIVFFLGIFIKKKKFYIFSIFILVFFIYALNLGIGIIDYNLNNLEKREDLSLKKMNLSNDKRNVHEFINDKKMNPKEYEKNKEEYEKFKTVNEYKLKNSLILYETNDISKK